jgi:hypothetical protein
MRYKPFVELCDVPPNILDFLNSKFKLAREYGDPKFSQGNVRNYMQWNMHLEDPFTENPSSNEWIDPDFKIIDEFFSPFFSKIFRFRFSWLQTPYIVDWHVPHLFPRIHIPLNDSDAVFELKETETSEVMTFPKMTYGKAYLVDVTILHRVVTKTSLIRNNAFFCFESFASEELNLKYSL